MSKIKYKFKGLKSSPLLVCFFTGAIYALPYYFKNLFFLSFISLTVFFVFLLSHQRRKIFFRYFYTFSLGFYFVLYLWLSRLYPFAGFGFTKYQSAIIIFFACIGIPLFHALLHTIVMSLTKLLPDNDFLTVTGFGAAWILSEWMLSIGPLGFPWGRAALSQVGFLISVQTVSLFGSYFIVIILVCTCMLFALAVTKKKRIYTAVGCSIIAVNLIAGTILYYIPVNTNNSVKTAVLQGNAASGEKWESGSLQKIWNTYVSLAQEAAENGAEVIVMPESAIPTVFTENGTLHKSLASIAKKHNITIISGVICDEGKDSYNSVIAVYPDGSLSNRYNKQHIVPFGEYIPYQSVLETLIPFIGGLNLGGMNTVAGDESVIIDVKNNKNGSLVCFDSIFDVLARDNVNSGAGILTVVTNDSWFEDSAGITQHLGHSVLRSIENRRYIIRAANTGISAFISPKGKIITQTEAMTEDIIYCNVSAVHSKTLYTLTGNILLYIAIAFYAVIILISIFKKINSRFHIVRNS